MVDKKSFTTIADPYLDKLAQGTWTARREDQEFDQGGD